MADIKKLLEHQNAPGYLLSAIVFVWFVCWVAAAPVGPGRRGGDYGRRPFPGHESRRAPPPVIAEITSAEEGGAAPGEPSARPKRKRAAPKGDR